MSNNRQLDVICQCSKEGRDTIREAEAAATTVEMMTTPPHGHGEQQPPHSQPTTMLKVLKFPTDASLICSFFDESNSEVYRRLSRQSCDVLNEMRCANQLCDAVVICDDGTEIPVHKAILSATSKYFRALFTNGMTDSHLETFHILEVDSTIMKLIIEWCYTRNVVINSANIEKLLPAADRFQLIGLISKCIEFLEKSIHYENVIGIRKFANCFYLSSLKKACDNFLMCHFLNIVKTSQEFAETSLDELKEILLSDELNVKNESDIFEVIVYWIECKFSERRKYLPELLTCLRLGYISKKYLKERIINHPYIKDYSDIRLILSEAMQFFNQSFNSNLVDLNDIRVRPRIPHELMMIVGGWSSGAPTNVIETYDPRGDLWQILLEQEQKLKFSQRAYHGCIFLDKYVYVIGGFDGLNYFNDCRRFDVAMQTWEEIAPMHIKRCYVSVATYNGAIYAMGGFDGILRQHTAEKYTPKVNQWTLIASMHEARSDASAAELDGKIYICGGFNGIDCVDTAEFYDPASNKWTLLERPMLNRRSGVGVVAYNGAIYAIGGYNGLVRLSSCERYDKRRQEWIALAEMYSPRSNFGIEVFDGDIFVMGGFNGVTTIESVESFDEESKEWRMREKMNVNRSALSVCVIKGIELVRPYSALKIGTNLEQKRNFEFIRNIVNFSNTYYYSFVNIN